MRLQVAEEANGPKIETFSVEVHESAAEANGK
jgi:hypothetical protein